MNYYLAIDIGASSGRHILGYIKDGVLVNEEIYRFENKLDVIDGHLCWNIEHLFNEVLEGLKVCSKINKIPLSIGIDTWGVDYVLLDKNNQEILPVYAYRDNRTESVIEKVESIVPFAKLYQITGIQKQKFNTIYQLFDDLKKGRLENASDFLMIPEYLNYKLTGIKKHEYTNASTTGLVDASTRNWSSYIIEKLGFPKQLFPLVNEPGTLLGKFSNEIENILGYQSNVILIGSHDTASAVLSYPCLNSEIYLSSGTWSLMGVELNSPNLSLESKRHNFTNEGGINGTYRYLKNIMGLWMLQSIRREMNVIYKRKVSFPEIIELAKTSKFTKTVDVNSDLFLAPSSMIDAIRSCFKTDAMKLGDVISCVYHSLAKEYKNTIEEIELMTNQKYEELYIVGGGSQDNYLNSLTKQYTGKRVFAGPTEATAIGNLVLQMIVNKELNSVKDAREFIRHSFEIKEV